MQKGENYSEYYSEDYNLKLKNRVYKQKLVVVLMTFKVFTT